MKTFVRRTRPAAAVLAASLVLAACGGAEDTEPTNTETSEPAAEETTPAEEPETETETEAAEAGITAELLRTELNLLLQEHVIFAGAATGAAIAGDEDGFNQAAAALTEGNSVKLADLVGSVYGQEVRDTFLELWNSHIGMFVRYTQGAASGDQEAADAAVAELTEYVTTLASVFEQVTGLPADASAPLIEEHVLSLKEAVDLQIAGDAPGAFASLREAASHMDMIAGPLAGAIASQQGLEGDASSDLAAARSALNATLAEHTWLAGLATGAAVKGDTATFEAAAGALTEGNSVALADLVGTFYGEETRDTFLELWNSHIGMFVAYTQGAAGGDQAAADAAVADLTEYVTTLASVFETVTEGNLPASASAPLIEEHVLTTKAVVDAWVAGGDGYAELLEAGAHMKMIANPLFDAIVAQQTGA
ncbi:MAG: hypothetical protein ACLGIR_08280 [Actinomycetes bacterium]